MKSKILLAICIIEAVLIIISALTSAWNEPLRADNIIADVTAPDNSKRLVFTEINKPYPFGFSIVEIYAAYKDNDEWVGRTYFTFDVNNDGGISKKTLQLNG